MLTYYPFLASFDYEYRPDRFVNQQTTLVIKTRRTFHDVPLYCWLHEAKSHFLVTLDQ